METSVISTIIINVRVNCSIVLLHTLPHSHVIIIPILGETAMEEAIPFIVTLLILVYMYVVLHS